MVSPNSGSCGSMAIREISDAPLGNERQVKTALQDLMKKLNEVIKEVNRLTELVGGGS